MSNYVETLWNKFEFLHERYRRQYNYLQNFVDFFTRLQNACYTFSSTINGIINKNYQLLDDKNSSLNKCIASLRFNFSIHASEFNELYEYIKKKIVEPVTNQMNDIYYREKDNYNLYIKAHKNYIDSRNYAEKMKKNYLSSALIAEKSASLFVNLKLQNMNSQEELNKNQQKMREQLNEVKIYEDKYINAILESNKLREEDIKKQGLLLKLYQDIDKNLGLNNKEMICYYIAGIKKTYSSILVDIDSLSSKFKGIDLDKDVTDFIDQNKSEEKPDKKLTFENYKPIANMNSASLTSKDNSSNAVDTLDINYEVLTILKAYITDVCKDINMEEEGKKTNLRFLSKKIFKFGPNVSFTPDEKSKLMEYIKEPSFRKYFLIMLSKQRTKGRFQRSEKLIGDLSDILHLVLEISENEKDYENAKNCIILSQTFYYEKKNEKKKHYLFESIYNNKWLTSIDFWKGIIEFMIQKEIEKNKEIEPDGWKDEGSTDTKRKLSNIAFSQVLPYSNNMMEFDMEKEDIIKVTQEFIDKYEIQKEMAEAILANIDSSYSKEKKKKDSIDESPKVTISTSKDKKEDIPELKEDKKEESNNDANVKLDDSNNLSNNINNNENNNGSSLENKNDNNENNNNDNNNNVLNNNTENNNTQNNTDEINTNK